MPLHINAVHHDAFTSYLVNMCFFMMFNANSVKQDKDISHK